MEWKDVARLAGGAAAAEREKRAGSGMLDHLGSMLRG